MSSTEPTNMDDQPLPGTQNGPYKYLRLYMDATVPSVPAWRFTRFPELPDELQVMIWEMALEIELKKVPRIIPVSTFLPPAREIHAARVLAQTCVKSREVALKCLADCRIHEENHQFYSDTPEELYSVPTGRVAGTRTRRSPPSRSSRSAEDRSKSPLHNHVHIDRDYLLFTGHATKVLRLTELDAQSYVHGVQKVMMPATVLWSQFSQSIFGDLDMGASLLKTVKEVVILLPLSMRLFAFPGLCNTSRCPSLSTSGFLIRIFKEAAHHENQRWAQASEVPYNLIRFWTDEEMAAFAASCSDRERYQPWNHDILSNHNNAGVIVANNNQNNSQAQALMNAVTFMQQSSLLSGTSADASASSPDSPSPSVSGADTPRSSDDSAGIFRGLQETNSFLYGMFQCWKALHGRDWAKAPMFRFAHVKGTETDQEIGSLLADFNGTPEKKFGLNWQDYIPAQSTEEIRSEVLKRESPLTNVKMSQRYSDTGEFEVEAVFRPKVVSQTGTTGFETASGTASGTAAGDADGW
ncbi:hypothetical protein QBC41DRAFT_315599 [Cercophora samala]|uniref:2EXR domain-containing protein n=1 Tax=Cercophora samala TaxID=330535 RepID=A0AA39ZIM1_9PEZI|nr:hypothetical protein QBC41DRAFT_315599 [Cercophora samala]